MDAHSDDTEKKIDSFVANKDDAYFDPVLMDPSEELTLHRGLKARQISMITVQQTFIACLLMLAEALSLCLSWEALWAQVSSLVRALLLSEEVHWDCSSDTPLWAWFVTS